MDTQSLLIADENIHYKDEFREDYETNHFGLNDEIGISLKSAQIGRTIYQFFDINIAVYKGNGFESRDFIFNLAFVPVLVGNEYEDFVNIGDKIKFNYLSKDIVVKVIEILEKGTIITLNNSLYVLDRYIVMPSLEIDVSP